MIKQLFLKNSAGKWLICVAALSIIVAAVGMQIMGISRAQNMHRPLPALGKAIPDKLDGWSVEDQTVGATEQMSDRAREMLEFDSYLHRSYSRAGTSFTVWIAYWRHGKQINRVVESHTPDICWTFAGWTMLQKDDARVLAPRELLPPGRWRTFTPPGEAATIEAIYWHIIGGKVLLDNRATRFSRWLDELRDVMWGTGERYFVRITTNQQFSELEQDTAFQQVLQGVEQLTGVQPDKTR